MTNDITRGSPNNPQERPAVSAVVHSLLGLFFVALVVVLAVAFAAGMFALRKWAQNRAAAKAVEEEVALLRLAGEPMTVEDLYRFHAIPKNVLDTTPTWLAAQTSYDPARLNRDGKSLPFVGNGNAADLQRGGGATQLTAAEAFLAQYAPTLVAILAAAEQTGACRYPTKFEQGISLATPDVQGVRTVVRLLALNVQVKAIRGQSDEAIQSLLAMFAASDTIGDQLTIIEQLVRMATFGSAMSQAEFLLNEVPLNDAQLESLALQVAACDIQRGFTRGLVGERALGFQEFQKQFREWFSSDCLSYLDVMSQAIQFSQEPLPDGRKKMQALYAQFDAQERAVAASGARRSHTLTALSMQPLATAFDSYPKAIAGQRALLAAIAAERYRLKSGHYPVGVNDLVPDYLPAVPLDPFDGQPLRFRAKGGDVLIYSIGIDGKDDGGRTLAGSSSKGDVVVRVSSVKGNSQ